MAAARSDENSDVQQDSESEEEESSEEEEVAPKRNAKPVKGRGGAAAAAIASSDDDEEDEDSESEEEEDDDDDDSSDDDFHDAPLADISEGEEEEDDIIIRGAKAGAVGAVAGAGAAARHRRNKSGSSGRNVANGHAGSTYKPKGTAGASRRAGPAADAAAPGQASSTNDTRARSDVTQAVKDKAARVAKLTAADVASDSKQLHEDIAMAHKALNLFLNSRMIEAERIVEEYADSRLYYALGYALIATIKGFHDLRARRFGQLPFRCARMP